ncbi:hypothetical protein BGZ51_008457 [Haplosporangium sp. Z 767]|nr:hypothetical protein BGZ50_008686 [Haplosporangium sp. Z 11]KAF9177697.1 hypothetical protein BGZ51_008457 [Haplosporangium sp. Z 767]
MDQLVEQEVPESPAKKNNKFKLLNTLRFLKTDRSGSSGSHGGAGYYHQLQQQQQQQQHYGPLTSPVTGLYPMPTMLHLPLNSVFAARLPEYHSAYVQHGRAPPRPYHPGDW